MVMTSRAAAYAELVAGLLDVRDQTATERFDAAVRTAVAAGRLDATAAAELRWLQRESIEAVVEHARTALPAALLGIDDARSAVAAHSPAEVVSESADAREPSADAPTRRPVEHRLDRGPASAPTSTDSLRGDVPPETGATQVRRLLVAGLTSLTPAGGGA
jgi:hypothetical protein